MRRLWAGIAVLAFTSLTAFHLSNEALAAPWAPAAPTSLPPDCAPVGGEPPHLCPSTPTDVSDGRFAPQLQILSDGTERYHFDAVLWNRGPPSSSRARAATAASTR